MLENGQTTRHGPFPVSKILGGIGLGEFLAFLTQGHIYKLFLDIGSYFCLLMLWMKKQHLFIRHKLAHLSSLTPILVMISCF